MKKARIMLSALAVFAVVGTALAFKAKTAQVIFCENPQGKCLVKIQGITTTLNQDPVVNPCPNARYATTTINGLCDKATVQFYQTAD